MTDVSPETGRALGDETLVQYLIGGLTDDEAEPLDELIVADDAFAVRLRAVEDDLVDAYVHGELTGDTLQRFTAHYLSSPWGRTRVEIAEALRGYRREDTQADRAVTPVTPATSAARRAVAWWWPLAAAAVLLLVAGLLAIDNVRLRRDAATTGERLATLEQRARQLEDAVNRQQSAIAATSQELARARDALAAAAGQARMPEPASAGPRVLAFVLLPANRDAGETPTIAIPANTGAVMLRLQLDGDDYSRYTVAIKDAATDRIVWRSDRLRAVSAGDRKMLPASVPAHVLRPGAYTADVTGIPPRGPSEPLDPYPFRVVLQ
jgi:hypothetical protein